MAYITAATELARPQPAPVAETWSVDSSHGEYAIRPLTSRIVRMAISGFWSPAVMADFVRDVFATVKALPCAPEEHSVLCDVSGAAIQSRPMFEAFLALLVNTRWPARRVAFVSTNPVSRMQARRLIAARDGFALFDDEAAALRWLAAEA